MSESTNMVTAKTGQVKMTIHPVPTKLWAWMRRYQDMGLTGTILIKYERGKVAGWSVQADEQDPDGQVDIALSPK